MGTRIAVAFHLVVGAALGRWDAEGGNLRGMADTGLRRVIAEMERFVGFLDAPDGDRTVTSKRLSVESAEGRNDSSDVVGG